MKAGYGFDLSIGGVSFRVSSSLPVLHNSTDGRYEQFIDRDADTSYPQDSIRILLTADKCARPAGSTKLFDAGHAWSIFKDGNLRIIESGVLPDSGMPPWSARLDGDFAEAEVCCGPALCVEDDGAPALLNPVKYPLDQILLMYALARRHGVTAHACGVTIEGRGLILAGTSGAGKSTIAGILRNRPGFKVLSDDRIVARMGEAGCVMFGTPWPGDEGIAVAENAPVHSILFLEHGIEDCIVKLDPIEAIAALLPVVSIPWYDTDVVGDSLSTCEAILRAVPAYRFVFAPAQAAGDALVGHVRSAERGKQSAE